MTATSLSIGQTGAGAQAVGGNLVARIGPCSGGTPNTVCTFDPGQDPIASVGYGDVVEDTKRALSVAKVRCLLVPTDNTEEGVIGSVTETPSGPGPTITVTPVTGAGGYSDFLLAVKVTSPGAVGVARVAVALDGSSYGYSYDVPDESPGAAIGTIDLTGITLSSLNGLTVLSTAETGGLKTTTLTTPSSVQDIATQINTAAGSPQLATIIAGRFLKVASATKGASSSMTIGAGTANTALGLTAGANAGGASVVVLPGTNLKLTFPATSSYVLDTVYTCTVTGPRVALEDVLIAMDALKAGYQTAPFSTIEIPQPCADGHDLRTWSGQLNAKVLSWQTGDFKAIVRVKIGGPLGTRGPAGIAANDLDVKNAMIGDASDTVDVAHGDGYLQGQYYIGSFRRSPVQHLAQQFAAFSLSEDPGNATFGALKQFSITSPDYDAATGAGFIARDENTATVKMGGSAGPGFSVVKTKPDGAYFVRGVSRAGSGSLFVDISVVHPTYYLAAFVDQLLAKEENTTRDVKPDGTMLDHELADLQQNWQNQCQAFIVDQGHASAVLITIEHNDLVAGAKRRKLIAKFRMQPKGQIEFVEGTVEAVGKLTLNAAG